MLLPLLLAGVLGAWLRFAFMLRQISALPNLARGAAAPAPAGGASWPRLSVVLAARDEAESIRSAVSSLLAQDYPALEVIAVDDRSRDATGAILDELAAAHPNLEVVHVGALPDGWLGKTNALARGAAQSTGELLLFTDADVLFADGALRLAVAWAVRERLGHAVALPHFVAPGLLERSFVSLFGLFFLVHLEANALGRAGSAAHVGVGAFNLVRRSALERSPGLSWLKMEVVDDIALGQMLKRSGARASVARGDGAVSLDFYRSAGELIRGIEKNGFATLGSFNYAQLAAMVLGFLVIECAPLGAVAAFGHPLVQVSGLAILALALGLCAWTARLYGRRMAPALLYPVGLALLMAGEVRSGWLAARQGGVTWRGTLYPLDQLRAGMRRQFL